MITPIQMQVVLFTDLEHSELYDMFETISHGDAEYTLVKPEALIQEIEATGDETLEPLVAELKQVPEGVLVALDG